MKKFFSLSMLLLLCSMMFAAPLSEGFEGLTFPPEGWKVHNGGGPNTWHRSTEHSPRTGEAHAQLNNEQTYIAHDDWLITPILLPSAANHTISFWSKNFVNLFDETFHVKLSTGSNNIEDFTVILEENVLPPGEWTQYSYDLSAYIGMQVYVAIHSTTEYGFYAYMDDFEGPEVVIPELPPFIAKNPLPKHNLIMVPLNSTLKWESSGGYPTSYDVYFGTTTPPPFVQNRTVTNYNPGTLQAGTEYYWQIVPRNSYGEAADAPIWKFTTIPGDGSMVTIGNGTTEDRFPLGSNVGYEFSAAVYRASELGVGNKRINMLAWFTNQMTMVPVPTKIYIKPFFEQNIPIDTWENLITGATLVYDDVHHGTSEGEWETFPLQTTFDRDNGDGILVLVERNYGSSGNGTTYGARIHHTSITDVHRYWQRHDTPPYETTGGKKNTRPNLRIWATSFESTSAPSPALLVAPALNETDVNQYALLEWGSGGGGPSGYKMYLGTNPNPPLVQDLGYTNSWVSPMLQGNTTYYWKVVPYNAAGEAEDCPVWSFTTAPNGIVYIGDGEAQGQSLPVSVRSNFSYAQSIYLKGDIRFADHSIDRISYYWNGEVNAENSTDWVIYMGHTNNSQFTSTTNWVPFSQLTQVFSGQVQLPATPGWIEIVLDTPFPYNNTRNLVIGIDENRAGNDGTDGGFYNTLITNTYRSLRYMNNSTNPNPASPPTGTRVAAFPNIRLGFATTVEDPIFGIAPESIDFGEVPHSQASGWQNIVITNTGGGTINIPSSAVTISGAHASMFTINRNNLPATINSGGTFLLPVRVTATQEGPISATVHVLYDGTTYDIELTAFALPYGLHTVGNGTTNKHIPVSAYWNYTYSQSIYPQSSLNKQNKRISKLGYQWNGVRSGNTANNIVVYMGHTDKEVFDNNTDWVPFSQLTEVFRGTIDIPTTAGWVMFDLDTPFTYNNIQNLVIAVDENNPAADDELDHFFYSTNTTGQARSIRAYSTYINPDPANPTSGNALKATETGYPNTRFIFADISPEPVLVLNPQALDFGLHLQNEASAWQNVILRNEGLAPLQLNSSDISIIGADAAMFEMDDSAFPLSIAFETDVNLPLRFTATRGGEISATLQINFMGEIYTVALSGEGLPTQMVTIGEGTSVQRFPLGSYYGFERSAALYSNAELAGNATDISHLGWYSNTATDVSIPTKIYLKSVFDTDIQNDLWANMISGATLVYDQVQTGTLAGNWNIFVLEQDFTMIPGANLLVLVERNAGGGGNGTSAGAGIRSSSITGKHLTWMQDNSAPLAQGSVSSSRPNLRLFFGDPVEGAPAAVRLVSPANGATHLPIEGFELSWRPNLAEGGMPAYYTVFMSQIEEDIFDDQNFETPNVFFNPVVDGGIAFEHNQRWYWAVEANNADGGAVSEVYRFDIIAPPAQISVIPSSISENLQVGESNTQSFEISNSGGLPLEYSIRFSESNLRSIIENRSQDIQRHPEAALFAEKAPASLQEKGELSREYLELQFIYPDADGNGEYGVASDGKYIYTSKWNGSGSQRFFRYSLEGEYLDYFDLAGISGIRDFTYDGRYFYGANASPTIYVLDFDNNELVRSFNVPVTARGIAYDADREGLWITNNFSGPLRLVDLNGNQISSLSTSASSLTGLAYDSHSGNGSIWANTQTGDYSNNLVQINAQTGAIISTVNVSPALLPALDSEDLGGGIDIVTGIVPGYATIIANVQNVMMYGLELCPVASWAKVQPRYGVVEPGSSATIEVEFNAIGIGAGDYSGNLQISHNAPTETVNLPLALSVRGDWEPVFSITPESWAFGQSEILNPISKEFAIRNLGGPYLELDAASFSISGDTEGNFSLVLSELPVSLNYREIYRFHVVFAPVSDGEKTAILNIQDSLGRSIQQINLSGTGIPESIGQVVNLQASVSNGNEVQLTWGLISGDPATAGWMHYDNGENHDGIGTGSVANFDVAIKFTATDLWNYAGMQLEKIRFFPVSGNTNYSLKLWTGADADLAPSTLLYTQAIPSVVAGQWNEILLDTPYPIQQGQALWVGYNNDVQTGADMYPAGCDSGPAVIGRGDLIALGGVWQSMATQYPTLNYNWNLQAYVNEVNNLMSAGNWLNEPVQGRSLGKEALRDLVLSSSGNPQPATRALKGYNVFRNGVQLNTELVPSPSYLDLGVPNGIQSYSVQGVYYSQITTMSEILEVEINAAAPHSLPFVEDWSSEDLATNYWTAGAANWAISPVGNPEPGVHFSWDPRVQNYEIPLTSYSFDATGIDNVELSFNIALDNYSTSAVNLMLWDVWNGTEWVRLGGYNSVNGSFGWRHLAYDISEHAANRIFKIRFVAIGEDSFEINHWFIDNIRVREPLSTIAPVSDLNISIAGDNITLNWSPVPNADWYWIYKADSPNGDFQSLGYVTDAGDLTLPLSLFGAQRAFIRITAGAGSFPRAPRLDDPALQRSK